MISNTLWVDQCHGIYPDKILQELKTNSYKELVILGEFEWDMPSVTKEFIDELRLLGVKPTVVHGSFSCEHYINRYKELGIDQENIIFWGTHFFNYAFNSFKGFEIPENSNKHPYICLNNRSHIHRCAMIDELTKRNLIQRGIVSWVAHIDENRNYPFKHFDVNTKLLLDDNFITELNSYLMPKQFFESFLHLVTESTHVVPFITEKTAKPILFKKPFLVLGSPGYSKILKNLGFELYDELFDYSFDDIENLENRVSKLVENLYLVFDKDLDSLYKSVENKIEHNYNRMLEIIKDTNFIPNIVKHRLDLYNAKSVPFMEVDMKYSQFMGLCHDA